MTETDPLDTEARLLAALAWCFDRWLEVDAGVPLSLDDQRRVLAIARRALLRIPLPPPGPHPADTREIPAWLLRLAPDPQQES